MGDVKRCLGVVQMDCVVGNPAANLNKIEHFAALAGRLGVELAIFPECVTTGYFLGDALQRLAEPVDGPTGERLSAIAKENGLSLAVGAYTKRDGAVYNSQLLFGPDGKRLAVYDKAHLFASEREYCNAGDRPVVVETPIGKVAMTICYDLIFPDYVRHLVDLGAEFVINSTNWISDPYQRDVWGWTGPTTQALISTRALENLTFVAMANRVGHEVLSPTLAFDSLGHSCVAGPSGKILASLPEGEGVAVAHIEIAEADLARWHGVATYRADRRPELLR